MNTTQDGYQGEITLAELRSDRTRRRLNSTRDLVYQTDYTLALQNEYSQWAFDEERAPRNKGLWRREIFQTTDDNHPLDLEIGTGNGLFFLHRAKTHPHRSLVGIEIKYKPLIQSIRRTRSLGLDNAAICRYHGFNIDHLFAQGEVNDIFIFFPDPWVAPRKPDNRLFQLEVLARLFQIQRPGGKIFLKTDSREYFDWSLAQVEKSQYQILNVTYDLHAESAKLVETDAEGASAGSSSEFFANNFVTAFERIFTRKGIPTNAMVLNRIC